MYTRNPIICTSSVTDCVIKRTGCSPPVISLLFCCRSSGSVELVFTRSWVSFPAGSLRILFSSKDYTRHYNVTPCQPAGLGGGRSRGIVKPTSWSCPKLLKVAHVSAPTFANLLLSMQSDIYMWHS